ncbi:hypothetical protein KEM52_005278 [Ascosphaera acerosa]|nr:hypothetical protein KEM52_005278 [Ascosphaera acerosa]
MSSVRVLSHETNGQLQHQSSPHALFSDLSSMDSKPASDLAADHWAVTCPDLHILSNMSMFDDHHLSADINIPLGIYHDDTTIELPARESVVDPSMEMLDVEIEGTPTLLTPTVVSSPSPASAKSLEAAEQDSSPEARVTRLIGEKHIDGEGVCYVYSDGTHCPKYIKGEPVNAKWGITKAGRPRKRLAQACIACRHRKIKCTPASPKCEQCKRSGKTCRFENAPRGNQAKAKNLGAAAAGDSDKTSPKPRSCKKGTTERTSGASAAESSTQASDSQPDPSPTDAIESDGSSK